MEKQQLEKARKGVHTEYQVQIQGTESYAVITKKEAEYLIKNNEGLTSRRSEFEGGDVIFIESREKYK